MNLPALNEGKPDTTEEHEVNATAEVVTDCVGDGCSQTKDAHHAFAIDPEPQATVSRAGQH